jgi:hypothetical protein
MAHHTYPLCILCWSTKISLTTDEKTDLYNFLKTLSDSVLITDPRFSKR